MSFEGYVGETFELTFTSDEKPPIFEKALAVFGPVIEHAIFAYDSTIYNCGGKKLPEHLLVHESTHFKQQRLAGGPDVWWDRYLVDAEFRTAQELEAYREQYSFFCKIERDRNKRFRFLHQIALDLSGALYGKVISYGDACRLIKSPHSAA